MKDLKIWENNNYKLHVSIIKNLTIDCIPYLIFDDILKRKGIESVMVMYKHPHNQIVTTLILGLWSRQGLAKVWVKNEVEESYFMFLRVYESVREWTHTFSSELSFWELESQWTLKFSKGDDKGQNLLNFFFF